MRKNSWILLLGWTLVLLISLMACSQPLPEPSDPPIKDSISLEDTAPQASPLPTPTEFEKKVCYLADKGVAFPDLTEEDQITNRDFYSLMVQAYEALGGEIDLSYTNPRWDADEVNKKAQRLGMVWGNEFENTDGFSSVSYGYAFSELQKISRIINKRLFGRKEDVITVQDMLDSINLTFALEYTSGEEDIPLHLPFTPGGLLEGEAVDPSQPLTRALAAQMMVTAYEKAGGEIPLASIPLEDTDSLYAQKANQFFIWPDDKYFEPEALIQWDHDFPYYVSNFEWQFRILENLEEKWVSGEKLLSAVSFMLQAYEDVPQMPMDETVVMNERPYDWYVYQGDTGEFANVNCMPSCVEMAFRYQGMDNPPSAEQLREKYPLDGEGWNDILAENVMKQYGLEFVTSMDITPEAMLKALDEGNILYVMYREPALITGHAVILKGYRRIGEEIRFLVSDPSYKGLNVFGYSGLEVDLQTMMQNIPNQSRFYFIIPPEK